MYGPDLTFLGVDRCDLADPGSYAYAYADADADADAVIVGAPFDGGTSHRCAYEAPCRWTAIWSRDDCAPARPCGIRGPARDP
jgi:hypothetical protein